MIVAEPLLHDWFVNPVVKYGFELLVVIAVVLYGWNVKKRRESKIKSRPVRIKTAE